MKTSSRRNFLKKVAVTAASAVAVPGLVKAASELGAEGMDDALAASAPGHGGLIVPKGEGLRITGTFSTKSRTTSRTRTGARRSGTPISAI